MGTEALEYRHDILARKRAIISERLGSSCIRCSSENDLEVDHIDPNTKNPKLTEFGRSYSIYRLGFFELSEELHLCQTLCRNCHKDKTLADQGLDRMGDKHNLTRYARGCRCEVCKDAKSKHRKEFYQKWGE